MERTDACIQYMDIEFSVSMIIRASKWEQVEKTRLLEFLTKLHICNRVLQSENLLLKADNAAVHVIKKALHILLAELYILHEAVFTCGQ